MITVQNKFSDLILPKRFGACTVWPFLFIRCDFKLSKASLNHERIHGRQQCETMLLTWFILGTVAIFGPGVWWYLAVGVTVLNWYLWYLISWLLQILLPPYDSAYLDICFEQEAYANQNDTNYLKTRRPFRWVKYLFSNFKKK